MSDTLCRKCSRRPAVSRGLCDACYVTHRDRQVAYGRWKTLYTDAEPSRQHIETLRSLGFGFKRIGALSGVDSNVLRGIVVGRGGYPPCRKVHVNTERRVLAVEIPPLRDAYALMAPTARVDITGTRRRLRALMAIGYHQNYLCDLISDSAVGNRTLWTDKRQRTTAQIAARVVEIFDQLQLTPGPSDRARRWAAKHGWVPPLAWDEDSIDNPDAQPHIQRDCYVSSIERYRELKALGVPDLQIPARLGIQAKSLARQLARHGLPIGPAIAELVQEERYKDRAVAS